MTGATTTKATNQHGEDDEPVAQSRKDILASFSDAYAKLLMNMPDEALPKPGPHGQHSFAPVFRIAA